jgi:hypothetical protein
MFKCKVLEDILPVQNDAIQGVKRRIYSENVCYILAQKYFPSRFLHESHGLKCYKQTIVFPVVLYIYKIVPRVEG